MKAKAMAIFQFVLLTSAIDLFSGISDAVTDAAKVGYQVTTVLDGNTHGLAFYNIYEDLSGGSSVIALDSTKSSIYRVSLPLSQSSAVELISGGKPGYRDCSVNEALFDHPKDLAVDSDGTIYVADAKNAAVRMISSTGLVTTIAGGSNRTGHNDGEGSEVTFSNSFDVTYVRSTCTLAIVDRGNRIIREIQLPQFVGRCSGASPNSPGSTFTRNTLLLSLLAGILGTVAGVIATILTISTRRLEQLQSRLCWATTEGPSSSTWKKTVKPLSTLQVKETLKTPYSVTRNAPVEDVLVWSPALIMEIMITFFEKLLYVLLYSVSLLPRLLCSQPVCRAGMTLNNNETDLIDLHEEEHNNQPGNFSMSLLPAFWRLKNFQHASPFVKNFLILEDLIDFSEPGDATEGPENGESSATVGSVFKSKREIAVEEELTLDSMVEKSLAELVASSLQVS